MEDRLASALREITEAAEVVMGEDENSPGWGDDYRRLDAAIDSAQALLSERDYLRKA